MGILRFALEDGVVKQVWNEAATFATNFLLKSIESKSQLHSLPPTDKCHPEIEPFLSPTEGMVK
jgi:hypothetical protein